jgi:hypothetical protein
LSPLSALSAFNGESASGEWTLQVDDAYDQDGGAINGWSINICSTQPLGIGQHETFDFALYPNPNNGSFNVQFTPNSDDVKISVHDIRGRSIFEQSYQANGMFNQALQLNSTQAGMYLVTVENGGSKKVKKIIIK